MIKSSGSRIDEICPIDDADSILEPYERSGAFVTCHCLSQSTSFGVRHRPLFEISYKTTLGAGGDRHVTVTGLMPVRVFRGRDRLPGGQFAAKETPRILPYRVLVGIAGIPNARTGWFPRGPAVFP